MKFFLRFIVFLFFSGFVVSCSVTKNSTSNNSNTPISLTDEQQFEFKYNFFEANKYFLAGNYDMAVSVFNQCLKIDPTSNVVNYKLASIYMAKKDLSTASIYADECIKNTNNEWYFYLAGSIYAQSNQSDKAIAMFNLLIELNPKEMDYYLSLSDVYLQANNLDKAIKVYDNMDKIFGKSELISLQKNKIYMAQNKKGAAVQELIDLYNYFGKDLKYKRLLGEFYIQISDYNNAQKIYTEILEQNPLDGYALIGLAECSRLAGDITSSFNYLKKAFVAKDLPSDVKLSLLFNIMQAAQNKPEIQIEVYNLVDILYGEYPANLDVKSLYVNLLLDKQDYQQARNLLREIIEIRKDKYGLWEQLILLENQFLSWDTLYVEVKEALTYFPNQSFLYFFHGFSAFQLGKYAEALDAFNFGYRLTTKEDNFRQDFISFLAECNYKLGNKEKAFKYFDEFLLIDPENKGILNNYAYYLSIDGINLDKAVIMSKKAVDQEPNNSTYLDTYAWVLFMQKNYSEALIYIKKAVEFNDDNSEVIIEHFGDILYFNNEVDKAVEQWIKALELGEGSGNLKSKIDAKKYID